MTKTSDMILFWGVCSAFGWLATLGMIAIFGVVNFGSLLAGLFPAGILAAGVFTKIYGD